MARIFISYSRADRQFVDDFVPLVRRVYGLEQVWFDDDIPGGHAWWQLILEQIAQCELFIYLLSNEALASPYCQAEFREALRLQKAILPVIVRPKTQIADTLPDDIRQPLQQTQWVDLSRGFKDPQANATLYAAINRLLEQTPSSTPPPLASEPVNEPQVPDKPARRLTEPWAIIIAAIITGLFAVVAAVIALGGRDDPRPTVTNTSAAQVASATPTPIVTPSPEPILNSREVALATRDAGLTQTAAEWTPTPTATFTPIPDFAATIAAELTALFLEDQTATATLWTAAPTPTPSVTATDIPSPTATPPRGWPGGERVTSNDQWEPVSEWPDAGFAEMVMVPKGCFMMGDIDGDDELPVHEICFDQPFYIDRFEVTNGQFNLLNGAAGRPGAWSNEDRPRESITWVEARIFCDQNRGARLPTEAEWEYAARGPDNLIYPYGNIFIGDHVAYRGNAGSGTAEVGEDHRQQGVSWVGAYDMSGNVWEWVSTIYDQNRYAYPYATDGRENLDRIDALRSLRGGSWFDADVNFLRANFRRRDVPTERFNDGGFRCARDF